MKKSTLLLLAGALLILASCRKEVNQVSEVDQAFGTVYDIKATDWSSSDNGLSYAVTFDVPELSDAIFDHGAVIVYLSFVDNVYEALPEVYDGIAYGSVHGPGTVTVDMQAVDGGTITPPDGEIYAKVVLIDATALSLHPGINLKDYNTVRETFHLN